jgi:hypothetical protein
MPYYGYGGQELEDGELDDLRREGHERMNTPTAEWCAQVNATLAELERRLAQLEADRAGSELFAQSLDDVAGVIAHDVAALEAKVEALSESLVRHQDNERRHRS